TSVGKGAFGGLTEDKINVGAGFPTYYVVSNEALLGHIGSPAPDLDLTGFEGVTSIGDEAFLGCGLTSVLLPDSVESIGELAFFKNDLESIELGRGIRSIGDYAFSFNEDLVRITIGRGVEIGEEVLPYDNNFRDAYKAGGAGTYCRDEDGSWIKQEYHTYQFKLEGLAEEYEVMNGLEAPKDEDFTGIKPVKLSIVEDQTLDIPYCGLVRVAPVGAGNLQLWAKDTEGKWHDINQVGWGPKEGFPITNAVTDVYVIPINPFEGSVTLKLIDISEWYGAEDDVVINQEIPVKSVEPDSTPSES
ncbi:MAG: leucine-rich repeat domain-containing protein, partial [Firmicutes bacterium]|nr:leucine-rich repeat domain-containing protein [Bacillota bacterium]